jgi:hypothetical protein
MKPSKRRRAKLRQGKVICRAYRHYKTGRMVRKKDGGCFCFPIRRKPK